MVKMAVAGLALLAGAAHAASLEVGTGLSIFTRPANGTWYQEGNPYRLDLKDASLKLGITAKPASWRWHAGIEWLGRYGMDAMNKSSDYAYFHNRDWPLSRWVGHGHAHGVYLTAGPEYQRRGFVVHPIVGVYAYLMTWSVTVTDWSGCANGGPDGPDCFPGPQQPPQHVHSTVQTRLSPILGVSLVKDKWSMDFTIRETREPLSTLPAIAKGPTYNFSLTRRFW